MVGPADFPAIYTVPDTSASFLITYSAFQRITATDTTSGGTPIVGQGVTAQAVVALKADGEIARGCITCLRLKASNCRVNVAARSAAIFTCVSECAICAS